MSHSPFGAPVAFGVGLIGTTWPWEESLPPELLLI